MDIRMTAQSVVFAAPRAIARAIGGQIAIVDRESKRCYRLDAVGSRIWELLRDPSRVERVRDVLVSEYDVAPGACERDLLALLEALADARLVEIVSPDPPARALPRADAADTGQADTGTGERP